MGMGILFGMLESLFPCMNQLYPMNGGLDWNFENWKKINALGTVVMFLQPLQMFFCDLSGQIFPPGNDGLVGVGVTFTSQDLKFLSKLRPFNNIVKVSHFSAVCLLCG